MQDKKVLIFFTICCPLLTLATELLSFGSLSRLENHGGAAAFSGPTSLATKLSSTQDVSSGWVYYNFYASKNCGGSVSYATGVPMNTCLSADLLDYEGDRRRLQQDIDSDVSSFQVLFNGTGR